MIISYIVLMVCDVLYPQPVCGFPKTLLTHSHFSPPTPIASSPHQCALIGR